MSHFKIERVASNGVSELNRPNLYPLSKLHTQLLVQKLGVTANHSENGMHWWYGRMSYHTIGRYFLLSVDRVGNALLSICDQSVDRLVPRCLEELEPKMNDCLVANWV